MSASHLGHTRTTKGKKVMVILRNGVRIFDRFEERRDTAIRLRATGWIQKSNLRAMVVSNAALEAQWRG